VRISGWALVSEARLPGLSGDEPCHTAHKWLEPIAFLFVSCRKLQDAVITTAEKTQSAAGREEGMNQSQHL
jgi:hypothetical protein